MKQHGIEESKENFIEGIDEEFQDLAVSFSKIDFSNKSNKDSIYNTTMKNISYKKKIILIK